MQLKDSGNGLKQVADISCFNLMCNSLHNHQKDRTTNASDLGMPVDIQTCTCYTNCRYKCATLQWKIFGG